MSRHQEPDFSATGMKLDTPMKLNTKRLAGFLIISSSVPIWQMLPSFCMITMRSQSCMAASWSWVIYIMVVLSRDCMRRISTSISSLSLASRLVIGSSMTIMSSEEVRARAMATRCCWPPESWEGM